MSEREHFISRPFGAEVGIFPDLDFPSYLAIDAANSHLLSLFDRSASHALAELTYPKDSTESQLVGSAIHCAVLEPQDFRKRFVPPPEVNGKRADKRTKAGKLAWVEHEETHEDKETIPKDDFENALRIQDALWGHPLAGELLGGEGANEVSVVWKDEETGEFCKTRPDRVTTFGGFTTIVDLKKTRNASRGKFQRDAARYGYYVQAAMQLEGLNAHAPEERRHLILAVEDERPFGVSIFEYVPEALDAGLADFRRFLRLYHKSRESGLWLGYPHEPQALTVPNYLLERS